MGWVEQSILWLQQLSPVGVLAFMFFVAYIENVFPPSPSDVLLVFAGTLIGLGTIDLLPALLVATAGSVSGFATAYLLGRYFEPSVRTGPMSRFLPQSLWQQVESLFQRFGYGIIVANRFLAGTRAIVSFFAGMMRLNFAVTTLLCTLSAAAWNLLLLLLGRFFGTNWQRAVEYLEVYSKAATVLVLGILLWLFWRFRRARQVGTATLTSSDD